MKKTNIARHVFAGASILAMAASLAGPHAQAKEQGDFLVRARAIAVLPDESATISTIGGDVHIGDEYSGEVDFTYFFTNNIAAELILATSKHSVTATDTSIDDIDLGSVWLLPPTLTLQYHFMPETKISPYVGAGVNYTIFYNSKPGALVSTDYDNAFGLALQAGVDIEIFEDTYLNLDVKKLWLSTDLTADAGGLGTVTADVDINPWIFGIGIGRAF